MFLRIECLQPLEDFVGQLDLSHEHNNRQLAIIAQIR